MPAGATLDPPPIVGRDRGRRPPHDGEGGGGDGGGGDDGGGWEAHDSGPPLSREKLGLIVFIAALSMLFSGLLAGYLVYRNAASEWPPQGFPPLPRGLWVSTVVILASSATLALADRAQRRGRPGTLRAALAATVVLGVGFVCVQAWLWGDSIRAGMSQRHIYGAIWFAATGIHALHVLGGIGVLLATWLKSLRLADPAPLRQRLELTGWYWHFVGALWVVLFVVLYLAA